MRKLLFVLALAYSCVAQTDGPAALPKRIPLTSFVSANAVTTIAASNLQAGLNAAVCGDSITVQPGDWVGAVKLPNGCDAQHAIAVTGQPGARILLCGSQSVSGGVFVTLSGFEIMRAPTCTTVTYQLVTPGAGAHDVIITGNKIHGDPNYETVRGVALYGTYNVAVLNNVITDFHCLSKTGTCTDSQAVAFGLGDIPGAGNYLIQGNILQAAAENILGGGGADTIVPCDITITGNTMSKPQTWNPSNATYAGKAWIVKNLFELKNGCRVLFEKNTLSNTWGGFSQNGTGILLTPKNNGTCATCAVTDVTIRNNRVEYTGASLQLACALSDTGAAPAACSNWSIHDNEFVHQQYKGCYSCTGQWLIQLGSSLSPAIPPLHDILIDHNTFVLDGWYTPYHGFLIVGSPVLGQPGAEYNINITNNVFPQGTYPLYYSGGATADCAYPVLFINYAQMFTSCWAGTSSFTNNVILTSGEAKSGAAPASTWPAGNILVNAGANTNTQP
jgi:hypothetical protein